MKWTRERPGSYVATSGQQHRPLWTVTGPGIVGDGLSENKRAITGRVSGDGRAVGAVVVGDVVEYAGKRGTISMVTTTNDGTPLFCIRLPHNKRQCLLRSEFYLAVP